MKIYKYIDSFLGNNDSPLCFSESLTLSKAKARDFIMFELLDTPVKHITGARYLGIDPVDYQVIIRDLMREGLANKNGLTKKGEIAVKKKMKSTNKNYMAWLRARR